jgi:hypothetical protein
MQSLAFARIVADARCSCTTRDASLLLEAQNTLHDQLKPLAVHGFQGVVEHLHVVLAFVERGWLFIQL